MLRMNRLVISSVVRFGKEVVENLVEPLLAGTFAGDIDHLSIQSMFPHFSELEKQHRSLILGMKKAGSSIGNNTIGFLSNIPKWT